MVAFDKRVRFAYYCKRVGVLEAVRVRAVRPLVEMTHVGVVTVDCHAQRPDAVYRDPECL